MKKQKIWLLAILLFMQMRLVYATSKVYNTVSPDGQTRLEIKADDAKNLVYRVLLSGKPVLNWSDLGFAYNHTAVGKEVIIDQEHKVAVKEKFAWPLGENDMIINHFKEISLDCRSASVHFKVIGRVYNGSVAFRYSIDQKLTKSAGTITREFTSFNFTEPFTIYQYNEESVFTPVKLDSLLKTSDLPTTLTNGKLYVSIGEAANGSYTKAVLGKGDISNSLKVNFRKDTVHVSGEFLTPWRTLSISTSAIGLHQFSDLPMRLSPISTGPVPGVDTPAWIKPGKLIRSTRLTTQGGLDCIDFAAKHNFQYIMFDAGWYGAEFRGTSDPTQVIAGLDMQRVIQHGKEKGIGVILYVNRVALRAKLDTILPLYKKWGIAGLKFGFVDGLSQEGITWLSSAIKKVYDHGFVLNIHDNYKPTGLSRTYPNLLTQEGIRGDENSPDAFHNTTLPFTRFLAGAGDFTFCYPNAASDFSKNLKVSKAQQLALTVVYFSPLQAIFWYGNPNDYKNEEEIEFFVKVPTVWNETHYLSGDIGQHVSVARRQGTTWYVGTATGLADWQGTLHLHFLENGKTYTATVYEDNGTGGIRKRILQVKKNDSFPVSLAAKGGQAMVLELQK